MKSSHHYNLENILYKLKSSHVTSYIFVVDFTDVSQPWSQDIICQISRNPRSFNVGLVPPCPSRNMMGGGGGSSHEVTIVNFLFHESRNKIR